MVATHNIFDVFITSCVALNTLALCMEYYDAPELYKYILEVSNTVFVVIFAVEAIIKMIGLGLG